MASQMPNRNLAPGLKAEYYILLFLSFFFVLLRSYTRLRITKCWGWDDTWIIFAWIFNLTSLIFFSLMVKAGLGRHAIYLPEPQQDILEIVKWQIGFQISIVICTLLTKISISLMILRIKNTKAIRYILWIIMAFMTLASIAMIVTEFISCIPLKALWTPSIKGRCIAPSKVYIVAYVQSGATIVTDLCLTTSPIVILWNVKISKKRKTLICSLMSLGLVATVCNAIRSAVQGALLSSDISYDTVPIVIVCILEMCSGIIAACIPASMPILRLRKAGPQRLAYGYTLEGRSEHQKKLRSETSREDVAWRVYDGDSISLNPVHNSDSKVSAV